MLIQGKTKPFVKSTDTLLFIRRFYFLAEAGYSYFSVDFRLKIFSCEYSYIIACGISAPFKCICWLDRVKVGLEPA